jgi:ATP-dependent RNA helicase DeaD
MSHDVPGTSTPVEMSKDLSAQNDSAPADQSSEDAPARVPVEVVVQDVADIQLMSPDEEVAMLLGETKPPVAVVEETVVEVEEAAVADDQVQLEIETESVAEVCSTEVVVDVQGSDEPTPVVETPVVETPVVETPVVEETPVVVAVAEDVVAKVPVVKEADSVDVKPEVVAVVEAAENVVEVEAVEEAKQNPFEAMGLSPDVLSAIASVGYETPSPIQAETVPYILSGRDLMGQAETGSGKTAAFAWPLLSKIDVKSNKPQVLVLAPTRELAIQVTAAFEKYGRGMKGFRAVTIYGGQSYETQLRSLSRGVQVVVGTPGRVMDHLRRRTLDLRNLKTLVLDEADEMLRMGFIDDVEWILEQIPEQRQILSFSATLPPPIQRIAQKYLQNPANVSIKSNSATADSIAQSCLMLHAREKVERLVRILQTEETDGVLVFVKTRSSTVMVTETLIQRGIIASALNGDIPQSQRERTVNQLKSGRINVVVATDVAARGLDVQRISHVINYDFPHDTEAYVHRIGRTGRAGRSGNAILFVEPKEKGKLSRLQRATNQRIDLFKQKSINDINKLRVEKFKQAVIEKTGDKEIEYFATMISEMQKESEIPFDKLAGALALLAQGDTPLLLKELSAGKSNWKKDRERPGSGSGSTSGSQGGGRDRGPMTTYRVEVGRSHGVGPGNIVGAVTNEADLSNSDIGRINIFDEFSTIDLPTDIPQDMIEHLKNIHVSGQRLDIAKSDRTYVKPGGRKSGPSHSGGYSSGYAGRVKSNSDKKYLEKKNGDKKPYAKKSYGDKPKWEKPAGDKSYGDKKPYVKKSYDQPQGEKSFSDKPKWEKPAGDKSYGDKKPYVKKSYDQPQGEKSFGDKPKWEKPAGDKAYPKKSTKRKSNASGERTEQGEKRDRYARDGENRYASKPSTGSSASSKYAKPKAKTKAATRVQGKRKAGATPTNPMKKYVKIRSSK